MDTALFRFVNAGLQTSWLDRIVPHFSDKDYVILPSAVVLGALLYLGGRRAWICVAALVAALMVTDMSTAYGLKPAFERKRPYAALEGVHVHRSGQWITYDPAWYERDDRKSPSFPSNHAANMAALTLALAWYYRRSLWIMAPLTLLVGFSRVYTGNHYPLDVLAGYAWGALCGGASAWGVQRLAQRLWGAQPEAPPAPMPPERRIFLTLLASWTAFNLLFLWMDCFDLSGDEAQYWEWSRRLELGYYSKPPMIAYLIRLFTVAAGNKTWAVRAAAAFCASGAVTFVYALTLRIAKNERAALLAAVLALAMPFTWLGSVLITIDPPLVLFWAMAMYGFHRTVNGEPRYWLLTGLALGLGMLTKYTMLALYASFALYLLIVDRRMLKTSAPWLALAVSALCMTGVVYWNWQHDWISVVHTASIGVKDIPPSLLDRLGFLLEGLGGQAAVVSPILLGFFLWALCWGVKRWRTHPDAAYLVLCFGVLMAFFVTMALTRHPHANWPVCAYLALPPLLAWRWSETPPGPRARRWLTAAVVLGCAMGLAPRGTDAMYLAARAFTGPDDRPDRIHLFGMAIDPDRDPTNRLRGPRELGAALSKHVAGDPREGPFLFSDRYQVAACMAFYTDGQPRVYNLQTGMRRYNQYDLWGGWAELAGRDGLFATGGDAERAQQFIDGMVEEGLFASGEHIETVEVWRGPVRIKIYTISLMRECTGKEIVPDEAHY